MRAAVLREYGVPGFGEFDEPPAPEPGQALVEVLAAGLNPVDVAICAGRFYAGRPPLPIVAGREGVGTLDGRRVYFDGPVLPFGSMAERALIDAGSAHELPQALSDGVAIAIGIAGLAAWLPLTFHARLQEGEHVLVLGASGVLGQVAVQAAKLLGAGRVVAAARSQEGLERCRALGADATVRMGEQAELADAFREAADGRIDVVLDPLFGDPFLAALQAASVRARIVQIGAGAAQEATIPSAILRGKALAVLGHTNALVPAEIKREAYDRMAQDAAAGRITIELETIPLERVEEAWERLQAGAHRKIVLVP